MINRCFISFWVANARSIKQNIHNPKFFCLRTFISPSRFVELEMTIIP